MSPSISMEETHRIAAEVVGELSLACVRQRASQARMESWIRRLREVADRMEAKVKAHAPGEPKEQLRE